jgi:hypothetical protein
MPIRYFRDVLTIDQNLISSLNAPYGEIIVLGARQLALLSLSPAYNYIIAADQMTVLPGAGVSLTGSDGNFSPSVTVLASSIDGALTITSVGKSGQDGADGEPGESGVSIDEETGKPILLPGGAGGAGENGEAGAAGGNITIVYASATATPTATSIGGSPARPE